MKRKINHFIHVLLTFMMKLLKQDEMSLSKIKITLENDIKKAQNDFEVYCKGADMLYNSLVSELITITSKSDDSIEYTFLKKNFCIISDYNIVGKHVILKTYQIDMNLDNYPNKKLTHVPQLDIMVPEQGAMFFKEQKKNNIVLGIAVDATVIHSFGKQYILELYKQLVAINTNP